MKAPPITARKSWRKAIRRFALDVVLRGRDTAIVFVVPSRNFAIARVEEALSPDELPPGAVVLCELSYLSVEARQDAVHGYVDRSPGEIASQPQLRPEFAAATMVLADRLLTAAWEASSIARRVKEQRR